MTGIVLILIGKRLVVHMTSVTVEDKKQTS